MIKLHVFNSSLFFLLYRYNILLNSIFNYYFPKETILYWKLLLPLQYQTKKKEI